MASARCTLPVAGSACNYDLAFFTIWAEFYYASQIIHLRAERDVLRMVNHPGLVNFLGGFQDDNCVYFVMEYVCGGEFFRHLKAKEK